MHSPNKTNVKEYIEISSISKGLFIFIIIKGISCHYSYHISGEVDFVGSHLDWKSNMVIIFLL